MTQNQEILYDSRFGNLTPEVAEKISKSRKEAKNLNHSNAEYAVRNQTKRVMDFCEANQKEGRIILCWS